MLFYRTGCETTVEKVNINGAESKIERDYIE